MKGKADTKPLQRALDASRFNLSEEVKPRFQESITRFMIPKGRVLVDLGRLNLINFTAVTFSRCVKAINMDKIGATP